MKEVSNPLKSMFLQHGRHVLMLLVRTQLPKPCRIARKGTSVYDVSFSPSKTPLLSNLIYGTRGPR